MSLSMHQASVTAFTKSLLNLKAMLQKAKAHALEHKVEESVFVNARLYPDMLPLSSQVQIATDIARSTTARLAGVEPPSYEDNEKTLDDLTARIQRTVRLHGRPRRRRVRERRHARDHAAGARTAAYVHGDQLLASVRRAERLFSRGDRIRDPAAQRRAARGRPDFLGSFPD